jgi:hypothetical protein
VKNEDVEGQDIDDDRPKDEQTKPAASSQGSQSAWHAYLTGRSKPTSEPSPPFHSGRIDHHL